MGLVLLFIADSDSFDYTKNRKKLVGKFFLEGEFRFLENFNLLYINSDIAIAPCNERLND